jgi:hypothetical protein
MLNMEKICPLSYTDPAGANESNVMPCAIEAGEEVQVLEEAIV